jgi:preprotein translocase subunit SecB
MEKTKNSEFQFKGFFIDESFIKIKGASFKNIKLNIEPEGIHNKKENKFTLILTVSMNDADGKFESKVISRGEFDIKGDLENLSDYFNTNAPAIVFPYIRAYISTLTNLSTAGHPVTLPTLRMALKDALKENTKIVE